METLMGRRPNRDGLQIDGLLLVDKPAGITSHDVVDLVRRRFNIAKVGHGGTLDPMATGLLVMMLGKGTKLSSQVMGQDKAYTGDIMLGVTTDTQDGEGVVLQTRDPSAVTRESLEKAFSVWVGEVRQIPPMVSAIKKGGTPLYKLARQGKEIEREARTIWIHEIVLHDFKSPRGTFSVRCSKGTYVRSLCSDVGEALGCGAHLAGLRRTASGNYRVEDAVSVDALNKMDMDTFVAHLLPVAPTSTPGA